MASRFNLDGKSYELPPVDELTMDESILVERYAGTGIEEIGENLPMGAVKALVIIAVMRERPEVREREISERIGKITIKEMGEAWEADESPPALGSPSESEEQPEPSGETGTADTWPDPEDNGASSSGLHDSPTGLISVPKTLAP